MVLAVLYCYRVDKKDTIKTFGIYFIFFIINLFQSILFGITNNIGIHFSIQQFLEYQFFYFSIIALILIVITINFIEKNDFIIQMKKFLLIMSWFILVIFFYQALVKNGLVENRFNLSNVNNYGAYVASIMPFHMLRAEKKKILSLIYIVSASILLVVNNCTIIFFGVAVEVIILLFLNQKKNIATFLLTSYVN